jgi:hypothetical protein
MLVISQLLCHDNQLIEKWVSRLKHTRSYRFYRYRDQRTAPNRHISLPFHNSNSIKRDCSIGTRAAIRKNFIWGNVLGLYCWNFLFTYFCAMQASKVKQRKPLRPLLSNHEQYSSLSTHLELWLFFSARRPDAFITLQADAGWDTNNFKYHTNKTLKTSLYLIQYIGSKRPPDDVHKCVLNDT